MCGSGHALWLLTRVIDSLSRGVWAQVRLKFWNVFEVPETVRIPVTKAARGPFSHVARIETVKASLQGKPLIDN
uniref:Uncharacterized protein n=1 Tax=Brassica campestris TaxID=3711 RepID=M4F889_BRACM